MLGSCLKVASNTCSPGGSWGTSGGEACPPATPAAAESPPTPADPSPPAELSSSVASVDAPKYVNNNYFIDMNRLLNMIFLWYRHF